jgi:hypothetical protein
MELKKLLDSGDASAVKKYMDDNNLILNGNKIVPADAEKKSLLKARSEFWNQLQQMRKILLNSLKKWAIIQ